MALVVIFVLWARKAERMTAYDRLAARFARIATIGEGRGARLGRCRDDAARRRRRAGDQLAVLAGMSHAC